MNIDDVQGFLEAASDEERRLVLTLLRQRYGVVIHPLETRWKTTAEAILEAIDQSSDLTQRGVRGVLAEAIFRTVVVPRKLAGWKDTPPIGDVAYDLLLGDGSGQPDIRVQVKLQRKEAGRPKLHRNQPGVFVVETQRTRTGKKRAAKAKGDAGDTSELETATRPYRVGEFDVLAVCLAPSSGNWEDFIYCASKDLLVRRDSPALLEVLQPIVFHNPLLNIRSPWVRNFDEVAARARLPSGTA